MFLLCALIDPFSFPDFSSPHEQTKRFNLRYYLARWFTGGRVYHSLSPPSLRVAEKLDQFGVDYIEGGWPGSNPRDMAFFEQVGSLDLQHARIAAFGSTRRAKTEVDQDAQVKLLLEANTPVVTIFGKSWLLHVTDVLRTTPEENLQMIEDTVRYLKEQGKEVIYDAEHFFDGFHDNRDYALSTSGSR